MADEGATSRLAARLLLAVAGVTIFNGFVNLIPVTLGSTYLSTILIDIFLVLALAHLLIASKGQIPKRSRSQPWIAGILLVLVAYALLAPLSAEPLSAKLLAIRSNVGYAFFGIYCTCLVGAGRDLNRLLERILLMSTALAAFGLLQGLAFDRLPARLQTPLDTPDVFVYFGTDINRTNGLIGNTIVFGAFLSLFYGIHFVRWVATPRPSYAATASLHLFALATTYSRIALAAAAVLTLIGLTVVGLQRRPGSVAFFGLLASITAPVTIYALWPTIKARSEDSFIVRQLFLGNNISVQQSNSLHGQAIDLAQKSFETHPWTGIGIATQQYGSRYEAGHPFIITDGALWARLMEGGLLLVVPYAVLVLALLITLWQSVRSDRRHYLAVGLLAFVVYESTLASLYNSAIFGKAVFILLWILVGIAANVKSIDPLRVEGETYDISTSVQKPSVSSSRAR